MSNTIKNVWGEEIDIPTVKEDTRTHHVYKDLVFFSEHRVNLSMEVRKHSELIELLSNHPQNEFELLIAQIAAYCKVAMNDAYTPDDLNHLCKVLTEKLVIKRGGIVFARELPPDLKE